MRPGQQPKNRVSIDDLKSNAADVFHTLSEDDEPVMVTQDGKPAGVVLSPAAYQALTERIRFLAAIDEGAADIAAGRVVSHETVKNRVQEELAALNAGG